MSELGLTFECLSTCSSFYVVSLGSRVWLIEYVALLWMGLREDGMHLFSKGRRVDLAVDRQLW